MTKATNSLISSNANLSEIRLDNISDMGAKIAPANPNCLVYLAQDSEAQNLGIASGNAISVGEDGMTATAVALVDGSDFNCSSAIVCSDIKYNRDFSSQGWEALYLPFEISYSDWASLGQVAKLTGVKEDSGKDMLVWEIVDNGTIAANTPCLFLPSKAENLSFVASGDELVPDSKANTLSFTSTSGNTYTISGTYAKKQDMATCGAYSLRENDFYPAPSDTDILLPFRVFINIDGTNVNAYTPCLGNILPDDISLIESIENDSDINGQIYDICGRKVQHPVRGLYIMDNTKTIIK